MEDNLDAKAAILIKLQESIDRLNKAFIDFNPDDIEREYNLQQQLRKELEAVNGH